MRLSLRNFFILLFLCSMPFSSAKAFWMWTPETGKWINPKNDVKPSPQEQLEYANLFFDAREWANAIREYKKLLSRYGKAREAAEAQFQLGRVWEEMKKYHQAVEAYQKVVDRYPFSDLGPKVVERQYFIAELFMEGKARDSKFASSLLGNEYNLVEVYLKVIKNDPYGPYAPVAQYKIGLFHLERQEYQLARDAFEKTLNDYPDSKWAESARYQTSLSDAKRSANAQYDQNITGIAVAGLEDFLASNPDSGLSVDAKNEIARLRLKEAENAFVVAGFYLKNEQPKAAKIYFQDVIKQYGNTPWAAKAQEQINAIDTGK